MTVYHLFDMTWIKLRRWIDDNAKAIVGEEKALFISHAMNRPPELALIVIADKLGRRKPEEEGYEETEKRRHAIETRNWDYAYMIAGDLLQMPDLTLSTEIMEKGFDFAEVFLSLVDQINSNQ